MVNWQYIQRKVAVLGRSLQNAGQEIIRDMTLSPNVPQEQCQRVNTCLRNRHTDWSKTVGQANYRDMISSNTLLKQGKLILHSLGNQRYEIALVDSTGKELGFIQYYFNSKINPLYKNCLATKKASAYVTLQKTYQQITPEGKSRYQLVGTSLKQAMYEHLTRRIGSSGVDIDLVALNTAVQSHARDGFQLSRNNVLVFPEKYTNMTMPARHVAEKVRQHPALLYSIRIPR